MREEKKPLSTMKKELIIYLLLFLIISPLFKVTLGTNHPLSALAELVGVFGLIILGSRKLISVVKNKGNK